MSAKTFIRTVEESANGEKLFVLVDNKVLMATAAVSKFKKHERVKVRIDASMLPRYTISSTEAKYSETFWSDITPKKST